jgi:hypothetical protein
MYSVFALFLGAIVIEVLVGIARGRWSESARLCWACLTTFFSLVHDSIKSHSATHTEDIVRPANVDNKNAWVSKATAVYAWFPGVQIGARGASVP